MRIRISGSRTSFCSWIISLASSREKCCHPCRFSTSYQRKKLQFSYPLQIRFPLQTKDLRQSFHESKISQSLLSGYSRVEPHRRPTKTKSHSLNSHSENSLFHFLSIKNPMSPILFRFSRGKERVSLKRAHIKHIFYIITSVNNPVNGIKLLDG